MTDRLYYTDARLTRFTGRIVAVEQDGRHVTLDRTAFYPTSGGQPHDTGTLAGVPVVDVIDEDTRIVHVCATPIAAGVGDDVEGDIDWTRRFDHMQQHSAQHLLSAWLADRYGWPTVSVHFGAVMNTVDVAAPAIDPQLLPVIEDEVNRAASDDRPITISFEDAASATGLRKPSDRDGTLRIVTIAGIDRSACGGTHMESTGGIGSIFLRRLEKTKGNTRIEFIAGLRAVARARADAALLTTAARTFTAAPEELPSLVATQQQRVAELERDRKRLLGELAAFEARSLWERTPADSVGVRRITLPPLDTPVRDAETLVQALIALGPCVVLATSPATLGIMLGASEGSGVDAGPALRTALQSVGGRGGGSPRLAQGTVSDATQLAAVIAALPLS